MTPQSIVSVAIYVASVLFVILLMWRLRRRKGRVRSGPGPGATGAVFEMLHQDKRRAIELIVEGRAEATDPEHADGTPGAGDDGRPGPVR